MSIEIRNSYVVSTNIESANVRNIIRFIDGKLPNIIETERDKVFEIANLLDKKGIDFWDEEFEFRNMILCQISLKILEALKCFDNEEVFSPRLIKARKSLNEAIDKYNHINSDLSNYDIKEDFYRLSCNYCAALWPSVGKNEYFIDLFSSLCDIATVIGAISTDDFNSTTLFNIIDNKIKDSKKLEKAKQDPDSLTDSEFAEVIAIGINNHLQVQQLTNPDKCDDIINYINNFEKKKQRTRKK